LPEKEFLEGIRRCLERAEAAHNRAEPDVCVMNAHLVVEYSAKVLSIRQGRTPKYETFCCI
jgi:HEPN domain-containing protein